jgi:hypothetical protein
MKGVFEVDHRLRSRLRHRRDIDDTGPTLAAVARVHYFDVPGSSDAQTCDEAKATVGCLRK